MFSKIIITRGRRFYLLRRELNLYAKVVVPWHITVPLKVCHLIIAVISVPVYHRVPFVIGGIIWD